MASLTKVFVQFQEKISKPLPQGTTTKTTTANSHIQTDSYEQSQQKGSTVFFYHTLVARCLHMINRHEKHTLGFFYLALSVPCLGKQHRHCTGVKQLFKLPLKHRSKQNEFPKLLPQQLKVWQWSAAVQKSPSLGAYSRTAERVPAWEDKTRFYAAHSLSLYSFPNHQRQLCTVADKKEVKLLKT